MFCFVQPKEIQFYSLLFSDRFADVNHCMQKLNDLSSCTESVGRNAPPGNTIDNVLSTMQPKDMFDKLPRNTTDVKKANQLVCRAVKNIAKMKKISENKSALAEDPLR